MANSEMLWHNDGHKISLQINRSEVEITDIYCPGESEESKCHIDGIGCVVTWFLNRYGMECNAGKCAADKELQICWTLIGDKKNVEAAQVWFMPMADEMFNAWLVSEMRNETI